LCTFASGDPRMIFPAIPHRARPFEELAKGILEMTTGCLLSNHGFD